MSRMICLSLDEGQIVEIRGIRYRVVDRDSMRAVVKLRKEDEISVTQKMSVNELASLLVLEEAILIDDLDVPDPTPGSFDENTDPSGEGGDTNPRRANAVTDLSHVRVHRAIDWQKKVYILKCLMQLGVTSPKSDVQRKEVQVATAEIEQAYADAGLVDTKNWAPHTLYHDLLRWRQRRYQLDAIQKKGLHPAPWRTRRTEFFKAVEELTKRTVLKFPSLTAANIHKKVDKELKSWSAKNAEQTQ